MRKKHAECLKKLGEVGLESGLYSQLFLSLCLFCKVQLILALGSLILVSLIFGFSLAELSK